MTTAEHQRIKALECEVKELRRANEILKLASAYFAQAELDRPWGKAARPEPILRARANLPAAEGQ